MADSSVPITAGTGTNIDTVTTPSGEHRQIVIIGDRAGYEGRFGTFRTPGRAATTHNLSAIFNATGSTVVVKVRKIAVDLYSTVVKAITVPPPVVRVHKITALPTGGTAGSKVSIDTGAPASSASVTVYQDASADGTLSGTALTATIAAGTMITQEFAGRYITAVGYEPADRIEFLEGPDEKILLRAGEGVVVTLSMPAGTSDPATDMWIVSMHWEEYVP